METVPYIEAGQVPARGGREGARGPGRFRRALLPGAPPRIRGEEGSGRRRGKGKRAARKGAGEEDEPRKRAGTSGNASKATGTETQSKSDRRRSKPRMQTPPSPSPTQDGFEFLLRPPVWFSKAQNTLHSATHPYSQRDRRTQSYDKGDGRAKQRHEASSHKHGRGTGLEQAEWAAGRALCPTRMRPGKRIVRDGQHAQGRDGNLELDESRRPGADLWHRRPRRAHPNVRAVRGERRGALRVEPKARACVIRCTMPGPRLGRTAARRGALCSDARVHNQRRLLGGCVEHVQLEAAPRQSHRIWINRHVRRSCKTGADGGRLERPAQGTRQTRERKRDQVSLGANGARVAVRPRGGGAWRCDALGKESTSGGTPKSPEPTDPRVNRVPRAIGLHARPRPIISNTDALCAPLIGHHDVTDAVGRSNARVEPPGGKDTKGRIAGQLCGRFARSERGNGRSPIP